MKIQFEKLDDGTGIVTLSGKNKHDQPFMVQDTLQPLIFEALTKAENLTISDVTQWVAVEDELPPNQTKEYEVVRNGNVEFDVWYYRDGKGYWYNYLGITHWKEKPEPPCV